MSEDIRFIVYTSGYNASTYAKDCLDSVAKQTYKNYLHLVIDDSSTDDTYQRCIAHKNPWVKVCKTTQNQKWLATAVQFLKPNDQDVVVCLDLDDQLYDANVLQKLAQVYTQLNCWLTYGSYVRQSRPKDLSSHCKPFPADILASRSFRAYPWITSHLLTFKGGLWNRINKEDLKDWNGIYADMSYDIAIMIPMLEMCMPGKISLIRDWMYIYNDLNPISDDKRDRQLQIKTEQWFRAKEKYKVIKF